MDKHFRGIVVNGYPFDFETSIFAQQNGIIPDRIFILENSHEEILAHYKKIFIDNPLDVDRAI